VSDRVRVVPLVSVVVPTRNSSAHIVACLSSIRAQTYARLEVVVVDNNSTDETVQLAKSFADHVFLCGPERSAQRNAGAEATTGDFLLFIDSDMALEPGVIRECVDVVDGRGPVPTMVVIPEVSVGQGFWARCKALERSCYLGDDTIEAARFINRDLFVELGGFDEALPAGPEDWDLHQRGVRAGARVARTSAYIRHDEGALRIRDTVAKKFHYGGSMGEYIRRHPKVARRQLVLVRPAFVRHWRTLAGEPVVAIGMLVMKSLEFAAGAAGLATTSVRARALRASRQPRRRP
jgi:glycosyltransferase involved in cell wall biosynthesis